MRNMKKILLSLTGLIFCLLVFSQQDSHYSQYMFNQMSYNPGYAGSKDEVCTNLLNRQQWVGMPGAPVTTVFNVNTPVKPFNINSGIALSIINDKIGYTTQTGISGTYCYKLDAGSGKLGIGISLGAQNNVLDVSSEKWYTVSTSDGSIQTGTNGDGLIPSSKQNKLFFDMGLGLYYTKDDIYLGLSSTHVNQPKVNYDDATGSYIERNFYVTGGYNLRLTNPLFELAPSFYINTDLKATELTVNTNVIYNKRFWGGLSYRFGNAIIGIIGIELMNGIQIGYSYDFSVSGITAGSHEFWIGYNFKINRDKTPQKYKSVRFL
jgi:type IX secretion system PorP/SprF family membrane protein